MVIYIEFCDHLQAQIAAVTAFREILNISAWKIVWCETDSWVWTAFI